MQYKEVKSKNLKSPATAQQNGENQRGSTPVGVK